MSAPRASSTAARPTPAQRTPARRVPAPPSGPEGAQLLARVQAQLARQEAGGTVFRPSGKERAVLAWLQYELGADMEMDRDHRYAAAYQRLAERRPRILSAIEHPASVAEGLSYPLDTGEVVELLQRAGLRVDPSGSAVRRLADAFKVPQLGSGLRRVFFARHVLQIASAIQLEVTPLEMRTLARILLGRLDARERIVAPMLPDVPTDQAGLLTAPRGVFAAHAEPRKRLPS